MAEEIRAMQTMKIGDVLDSVPGVKAGDTSVSIHGSSKVKVFLDGRPLNDPTSSHGAVNWDLVSPENVARIEILRGKGGLAYGQDAAGGVILIYSRQDTRRVNAGVKAYAGNHDTSSISVTFDTTVDQWRGGLSATGLNTQGYKINNDKDRYQLGANVGYDIKEDVSAGLSVDYLYDERGLSGLPEYPTPHSRKESGNTGLALHIDVRRWKSKTHYNEGYNHNTDPSRSLNKTLRVAKFGQTLTTEFRTTDHGDLNCGTAFTWDRAAGTGFEDQQENSGAVFGAQSYTWPSANLTLVAGLRGEYHSVFGGALNPEVKVAYQRSIWRISTAYSHSYNTPSLYQRYNETSSTRPNPDLQMETADNFSLSWFISPFKFINFSLSGFYNLLNDRITYITGSDGIGKYQNFGWVTYAGGDVAVDWQVHRTLNLKAGYTYMEVKDQETGLWLPCKPRHRANLTLNWQPVQALSITAEGRYTAEVYRNKDNTRTIPENTLIDLRGEYSFKRWSVFTEIDNVFDTTWYYVDGLLGPPLTWILGVCWRI